MIWRILLQIRLGGSFGGFLGLPESTDHTGVGSANPHVELAGDPALERRQLVAHKSVVMRSNLWMDLVFFQIHRMQDSLRKAEVLRRQLPASANRHPVPE